MSGILVVHGGADHARALFAAQGRPDWSQALPVVLEKHGILGFEVAPASVLESEATLRRASCVLIADLPQEAWTRSAVQTLRDSGAGAVIGTPPPLSVQAELGIVTTARADTSITVATVDPRLHALCARYGTFPSARLDRSSIRAVDQDADMHWRRLPQVPLTERQAQAWQAVGWTVERWNLSETDAPKVLGEWRSIGEPGRPQAPALVRRDNVVACAFGLFAALGQMHSSEPWGESEFRTSGRTMGLEVLLLGLIDLLHADRGTPRPRIRPWPRGASWALTVRHDFDRPLSPERVQGVLDGHAAVGTAATWYWRARHLRRRRTRLLPDWMPGSPPSQGHRTLQRVVQDPRHEVAHHTERLWTGGEEEQAAIESAAATPVAGTCAHGDRESFRFQGAPNILWAEARGMLYTEFIQHSHLHPHRFAALRGDGCVDLLDVICLPHHESFDRSTRPGDAGAERVLEAAGRYIAAGGLMQVMSHPDINVELLMETLAALPRAGRWNCTAYEAASWWRRSHVHTSLSLKTDIDGRVEVTSEANIADLSVEYQLPDGSQQVAALSLQAGTPRVAFEPQAAN